MEDKKEDNIDILEIPSLTKGKSEIFTLVDLALSRGASDLILSMGSNPTIRVDGKLFSIFEKPKLTAGYIEKLIDLLINKEQKKTLEEKRELDFSYIFKDQAFLRGNVFYQKNSISAAIRIIPAKIRNFAELNLPETIDKFTRLSQGLVLITGPSGSGKSTTIAAILEEINRTRADHILTVEDPIEYVFSPKQSIISQREVNRDTLSFSSALRSALRENFNILFIGELRDAESIEAALNIAETGHLVFATIHSGGATLAPDRIINAFPPHFQSQVRSQLASVLLGVIAQRLFPKTDGGRIPAVEIMFANDAVKNIIRDGKTGQLKTVLETSASEGMITFEKSIKNLVDEGKIARDYLRKMK